LSQFYLFLYYHRIKNVAVAKTATTDEARSNIEPGNPDKIVSKILDAIAHIIAPNTRRGSSVSLSFVFTCHPSICFPWYFVFIFGAIRHGTNIKMNSHKLGHP